MYNRCFFTFEKLDKTKTICLSIRNVKLCTVNISQFYDQLWQVIWIIYAVLCFGVFPVKRNLRNTHSYLIWTMPAKGKERMAEALGNRSFCRITQSNYLHSFFITSSITSLISKCAFALSSPRKFFTKRI